jgi:hypothetical protein
MSPTKVTVADSVLQWAIERSGIAPSTLAHQFPKLRQWRTGDVLPTLRQLETFARTTWTPFGYLVLNEPPIEKLSIPHFRTLGDKDPSCPTSDLLETVQAMERRQAWMRDFLVEQGQGPMPFVRSAQVDEDSREFAGRIRHTLGLGDDWAEERPSWTDALRCTSGPRRSPCCAPTSSESALSSAPPVG